MNQVTDNVHSSTTSAKHKSSLTKLRRATRLGTSHRVTFFGLSRREMISDEAEVEVNRPQPLDLLGVEPVRLVGRAAP